MLPLAGQPPHCHQPAPPPCLLGQAKRNCFTKNRAADMGRAPGALGDTPRSRGCGAVQAIECRPIMLPSVSVTRAAKPYSPMANLGLNTWPPAAATRPCSTAQSSQPK